MGPYPIAPCEPSLFLVGTVEKHCPVGSLFMAERNEAEISQFLSYGLNIRTIELRAVGTWERGLGESDENRCRECSIPFSSCLLRLPDG